MERLKRRVGVGRGQRLRKRVRDTGGRERSSEKGAETQRDRERLR